MSHIQLFSYGKMAKKYVHYEDECRDGILPVLINGLASFLSPWGFLCRGRGDGKGVAEVPGSSLAGEVGRCPLALYQRGRRRKPAMRSFKPVFVSQACETKDNVVQEIDTRGAGALVLLIESKALLSEIHKRLRARPYKSFSRHAWTLRLIEYKPCCLGKGFCAVPHTFFHLFRQLVNCNP